ncbi:MAG: T9SS type A sorting domain-containing protein [Flavobacteriales bacterium]|nr:MAG: T9SS type A sorting domain-containing protein [Flavobacteriales bacterium]
MKPTCLLQLAAAAGWSLAAGSLCGQTFNVVLANQLGDYYAEGHAVKCLPDGYLVFGNQQEQLTLDHDIMITKFDLAGNMVWQMNHSEPGDQRLPQTTAAVAAPNGTGYLVAVNTYSGNATGDTVRLVKYNTQGDTLWTSLVWADSFAYGRSVFTDGVHICVTGRFIDGFPQPNPDRSFIVRLDTSGVVLDRYRIQKIVVYAGNVGLDDAFYAIGMGQLPSLSPVSDYLMKFDSTGVDQWAYMFPGPFAPWFTVLPLSNGTVLCLGRWDDALGPAPNGSYMLAVDTGGTFAWDYRGEPGHWDSEETMFTDAFQDSDTTFIACASVQRNFWVKALIYRFSLDGDSLWRREYSHFNSGMVHAPEVPWDIEPALDGGIVLTGEVKESANLATRYLWLLKLDSLGCLVPGCQYVGLQEQLIGLEGALQVAPNPSAGRFNLQLEMPAAVEVQGDLLLQVFDPRGRLVVRRVLGRQLEQTVALDLSGEPPGVYNAHITDEKRMLTGVRLVVE